MVPPTKSELKHAIHNIHWLELMGPMLVGPTGNCPTCPCVMTALDRVQIQYVQLSPITQYHIKFQVDSSEILIILKTNQKVLCTDAEQQWTRINKITTGVKCPKQNCHCMFEIFMLLMRIPNSDYVCRFKYPCGSRAVHSPPMWPRILDESLHW